MLAYRVRKIQTGVYIFPWAKGEEATLSVSGDRQVTLHCAGGLLSDPFAFDDVVFAPFYKTLYSCCVEDGLRLQFGSALQRRAPSFRDVPRRTTIVHGDAVAHAAEAFYKVLLLASKDVECIAGAHHAQSAYECVFNMVRVYPWGEEDLLEVAGRENCCSSPSYPGTASAQEMSLWNTRTSVPLRTAAQRQLFKQTLKQLCCVRRREGQDDTAVCVQQVRLAVYAPSVDSTTGDRVLCAEHLFSLVPSVSDVATSFGTTMEALCETLVCRRQGNLLDNPLLSVLLPGVSVDCLTILTCISARGEYASRPCIDACCFGCSSERRRRPVTASSSFAVPTSDASRNGTTKGMHPECLESLVDQPSSSSHRCQRMTSELLMSVAANASYTSWQTSQVPNTTAAAPRTPLFGSSGASNRNPFVQLDESVDRMLERRHPRESPWGKHTLPMDSGTCLSPSAKAKCPASSLSTAEEPSAATPSRRAKSESCESNRGGGRPKLGSIRDVNALRDRTSMPAKERGVSAGELEASGRPKALQMDTKLRRRYAAYDANEATLSAHREDLQTPCAELTRGEQKLHVLVGEEACDTADLPCTAQPFQKLDPPVEDLRQRKQDLSTYLAMLDSYAAYVNTTCCLYADQVDAKMLLLDGVKRDLTRRISVAELVERACMLDQQCEDYDRRVKALQRQEAALSHQMSLMEVDAAALRTEIQLLEDRRDSTQRDIDDHKRAAAVNRVKALEEYEESLAHARRVQSECDAAVLELADLVARSGKAAEDLVCKEAERDTVRAEVHALEVERACLLATLNAAREAGTEDAARVNMPAAIAEQTAGPTTLEDRVHLQARVDRESALHDGLRAEVDTAGARLDNAHTWTTVEREMLLCSEEELEAHPAAQATLQSVRMAHLSRGPGKSCAVADAERQACFGAAVNSTATHRLATQTALEAELARLQQDRDTVARELEDLVTRRAKAADDVACKEAELARLQATLSGARKADADEAAVRSGAHGTVNASSDKLCDDDGPRGNSCSLACAKCIVEEELRKVIEELSVATEELAEVEDVMIEEADRAVLVLRRCDGEMTLRLDRLMNRCASFMDVESRLAGRSASMMSENSSQRHTRMPHNEVK
ncbi:hypothetical protein, unknown function [Leishmania tarentolae]|uniref:Uncharacterized protein n=1 Tax=Leishmania tarentolae TaxID=5689 RepID=A0A640KNM9_LEITA|nr:hypothetical protein, unknown function [Leishmania tarentolae]